MLTEVLPCEPPELVRDRATGPSIAVDCAILEYLKEHPGQPLSRITRGIGGRTHHVHARVQVLIDRGLVLRLPTPGGPQRGPGASWYYLTEGASWTCPS